MCVYVYVCMYVYVAPFPLLALLHRLLQYFLSPVYFPSPSISPDYVLASSPSFSNLIWDPPTFSAFFFLASFTLAFFFIKLRLQVSVFPFYLFQVFWNLSLLSCVPLLLLILPQSNCASSFLALHPTLSFCISRMSYHLSSFFYLYKISRVNNYLI